jgi:4-hydroxybenzoyl-CoA reductase subunit beta
VILAPFELHLPESLEETLALVRELGEDFDFIAGGTDLLQNYKNRLNTRNHLIALERVPELRGIRAGRIGATERLADVAEHATVRERFPGLSEAIRMVASPLIRSSGTIGGNLLVENRCSYFNQTPFWRETKGSCMKAESDVCLVVPQKEICYAAYSGDLAAILMVLDAGIELVSPRGSRRVKLTEFYRGDGIERNVLAKNEILTAIEIPEESASLQAGYRKLRHRDTLDYPEMGVAAALRLDGRRVALLRVATTAVDVVPQFRDFTGRLAGTLLEEGVIEAVSSEMEELAQPKKNTSMPVGYRKKMVRVYLHRLLRDLVDGRSNGDNPS